LQERFGQGGGRYSIQRAIVRAGGQLFETPALRWGSIEEKQLVAQLVAEGVSFQKIADRIGRSHSFVSRIVKKFNIQKSQRMGPDSTGWRGGVYKDSGGYMREWVPLDDPLRVMSLSTGHVLQHRLVMARHLGRPLMRNETIHHIDGDKTNNILSNLQLRHGKHGKHEVRYCEDCGSANIGHAIAIQETPKRVVLCCFDCASENVGYKPIADAKPQPGLRKRLPLLDGAE
jgi:Homeodomain-like domain/HNH endonuclease